MDWEVDAEGNIFLPHMLRFRTAMSPVSVVARIECTDAEMIEAGISPLGFQFQMTSVRARALAAVLIELATALEETIGMTKQ